MIRLLGLLLGLLLASPAPAAQVNSGNSAAVSNLVAKTAPGGLLGVYVTATAAGFVMILDTTSLPANGALAVPLLRCYNVGANTPFGVSFLPPDGPLSFINGITIAYSSTGCFSLTASATAFIGAEYQ